MAIRDRILLIDHRWFHPLIDKLLEILKNLRLNLRKVRNSFKSTNFRKFARVCK